MEPPVYVRCPSAGCRQILKVQQAFRGLLVTCHYCKRLIRVPLKREPQPAAGRAAQLPHS